MAAARVRAGCAGRARAVPRAGQRDRPGPGARSGRRLGRRRLRGLRGARPGLRPARRRGHRRRGDGPHRDGLRGVGRRAGRLRGGAAHRRHRRGEGLRPGPRGRPGRATTRWRCPSCGPRSSASFVSQGMPVPVATCAANDVTSNVELDVLLADELDDDQLTTLQDDVARDGGGLRRVGRLNHPSFSERAVAERWAKGRRPGVRPTEAGQPRGAPRRTDIHRDRHVKSYPHRRSLSSPVGASSGGRCPFPDLPARRPSEPSSHRSSTRCRHLASELRHRTHPRRRPAWGHRS